MAFMTVAAPGYETDLAFFSQWQWSLPCFSVLMAAHVLFRAATLRLVTNGYPPWVKRAFLGATVTVSLAGGILLVLMDPDLVRAADGWPAVLVTGLGSLSVSVCFA